ncbi:MAG: hypothetical protein WC508_00865 [Patescibacteria group bacterium]
MAASTEITVNQKPDQNEAAEIFKRRMLEWLNPVEFVNNMYGCHPGDGQGSGYFACIFAPIPAL